MSSSNCCFLTCIQISQEAGQVVWYSHLFQNFPQFIVIHTVKGFGTVNKAEIDSPWNSPDQNTRASSLSLLQRIFPTQGSNQGFRIAGRFFTSWATRERESESHSVVSNSLQPHGLHSPWNSPDQNTGVGCHFLLQGIFLTQESNPSLLHLLHCRLILYQLSHKGSPRILEWVVHLFSSRSSQPRNWTRVSCIAGGLFTNWAIREAPPKIFWLL